MSKVKVGESALLLWDKDGEPDLHKYTCGDVEIIEHDNFWPDEYRVRAPDGTKFWALECVLRKKPQPPDWNKLSTPTEKPVEVVA